jgi:Tol biopolymer transport system component
MIPKEVNEMLALTRGAFRGGGKRIVALCLMAALVVGLAACRGFFGQAPIAFIVPDTGEDSEVPVIVTFDLSDSSDPDGTIASFELDFGDGSTAATGTDVSLPITHEYDTAGTYTVILTITDNDGRIGMDNAVLTIGPVMITFAAIRAGDYDIFRMEGDGSDQGAVLNTANDELFPDLVLGTRDKIAYAAEDGTSWNIWTMTTLGGGQSELTTQTPSNQIQPSWSNDGTMIAYASNAAQTPSTTTWQIYTMTAAGASQTQLTSQSPSWAIAPAYSPVNDDILFVSNKNADGGSSIWWWDDSLGAAVELYDSAGRDGDASPALSGVALGLDLPAGAGISKPKWSADGTKIAFSRERTVGGIIDIYVMDDDGTNAEPLEDYVDTEFGVTNTEITTDADEFCPFWLEDGSGLAFVREETGGDFQVYKVDFTTGAVTQLTESGDNVSPASVAH